MTAYQRLLKHLDDIHEMLNDSGCPLHASKERCDAPISHRCVSDCPHRERLKGKLRETLQVLEESRQSFKSRQLEALCTKLIEILAEIA